VYHEDRSMLAIAWAGREHPKNLITQGGLGPLKPLLKQGLPKPPNALIQPRLGFLFHAGNGGFDGVNVGAQVTAVGSSGCSGRGLVATRPSIAAPSQDDTAEV
jgi:hypothetical protein